jgi:transporter family protein
MKSWMIYAVGAGLCWGLGGYFEKAGLRRAELPPIAGITIRTAVALLILGLLSIPAWKAVTQSADMRTWLMIILGGGVVAGSLGMWSFYSSLATTENLGATLAIAFAVSPLAGTAFGLLRGDQPMDARTAVGLLTIVIGIVVLQSAHHGPKANAAPAASAGPSSAVSR